MTNPDSGLPFTEAGAWHFIADHLEAGHPIEETVLEQPPGVRAYVLQFPAGDKTIYAKLQFSRDKVLGRSFHYSLRSS